MPEPIKCKAMVYVRDTYRVSRGSGARVHYEHRRCKRDACEDGLCRQHKKMAQDGLRIEETRFP